MKITLTAILIVIYLLFNSCTENAVDDNYTDCHLGSEEFMGNSLPDTPDNAVKIQIQRSIAFRNSLPCELFQWTFQNPNIYAIVLNEFLDDYTARNKFVAINMIWSMTHNSNYSGDKFYADADEGSAFFTGDSQFIPHSFIAGDLEISVNFGSTFSDGKSAEKAVSPLLTEILQNSIANANHILPPNQKITSIEIKSTTNGTHIRSSNHTKKTAIDISKINDVEIIQQSTTAIVPVFQQALDQEPYIRENFGPAFKHKTFADGSKDNNFKVPGHFDHIHISVQ
jgi:hypothetical protein